MAPARLSGATAGGGYVTCSSSERLWGRGATSPECCSVLVPGAACHSTVLRETKPPLESDKQAVHTQLLSDIQKLPLLRCKSNFSPKSPQELSLNLRSHCHRWCRWGQAALSGWQPWSGGGGWQDGRQLSASQGAWAAARAHRHARGQMELVGTEEGTHSAAPLLQLCVVAGHGGPCTITLQ